MTITLSKRREQHMPHLLVNKPISIPYCEDAMRILSPEMPPEKFFEKQAPRYNNSLGRPLASLYQC